MVYCFSSYNILIKELSFKKFKIYLKNFNNILFFSFIIKNYDFYEFFNIYFNKYYKSRSLKKYDKAYAYRWSASRRDKDSCN